MPLSLSLQPNGYLSLEQASETPDHSSREAMALESTWSISFREDPGLFLLQLGLADPKLLSQPSLRFFHSFASLFPRKLLLHPEVETLRGETPVSPGDEEIRLLLDLAPPMSGAEYLNAETMLTLWKSMRQALSARLSKAHSGSVEDFINALAGGGREIGRIHFHLVEHKDPDYPFAFLATYGSHAGKSGRTRHLPLRHALEEFQGDTERQLAVIKSLHASAKTSPWLKKCLDTGEIFQPLLWTPNQAHDFLKDVDAFETAGILCRIPNFWKNAKKGPSLRLKVGDSGDPAFNVETLVSLGLELMLGDHALSEADLKRLAQSGESLALIKGKWVAVDSEKIQEALSLLAKAKRLLKSKSITLSEAFRLLLGHGAAGIPSLTSMNGLEVSQGQWLNELTDKMRNPSLVREVKPPVGLKAELRPYQKLGLNWLQFLHGLGFGACLADDMGLGKTVQVLALLQNLKEKQPGKNLNALLIAPASLLFNWSREMDRFTPNLKVHVAHAISGDTHSKPNLSSKIDLVLTTYAMMDKLDWVKKRNWDLVVVDEAQALKNPGARQTKAIKALRAERRIAMTGTPIENRLTDLWSLFDFLNPGLLGTLEEFKQYQKDLQKDTEGYARLRRAISPYLLRRMKTDKNLVPDLPDKVEMKAQAELTAKQVALYRRLSQKLALALEDAETRSIGGFERQGLVLSYLIKFKQICNHPDHFSDGGNYAEKESGKFALLREICDPIREKRERVLVFTQFAEIAQPLADFLADVFGREGLVLTGKTPVAQRRKIVDVFQAKEWTPFLVLSVKAGGTGLNLTQASHVIHFDRWWNPAVENQATDRAFRLGQTKNVLVHKFITRGTLEEKIDALIDRKTALARDVITSTGEGWITKMGDKELLDLFSFSTLGKPE